MSIICHISTAVPEHKYTQPELTEYLQRYIKGTELEERKRRLLSGNSGIKTRYSVLPDFKNDGTENVLFTTQDQTGPGIEERMECYHPAALQLSMEAIKPILEKVDRHQITHLITVSCTGMSAPGLDIELVNALGLSSSVNRTSINFMGCYAAMHALKQADYIARAETHAMVLIVCVELCSLHFQAEDHLDNLASNLLFADGAAAALIVSDQLASTQKMKGFHIDTFHSGLAYQGKKDMTWSLSGKGFLMNLSAYIPQLLEQGMKTLFDEAIAKMNIQREDLNHWAIHPGGRKVLEVVQKELSLNDTDLHSSYKILSEYGNMSSPTILFVLKEIWENKVQAHQAERTFAVAFGPGITMESVLLSNA